MSVQSKIRLAQKQKFIYIPKRIGELNLADGMRSQKFFFKRDQKCTVLPIFLQNSWRVTCFGNGKNLQNEIIYVKLRLIYLIN